MGGHHDNPSVLVTGGAGFLGHALIHELLHDGSVLRAGSIRSLDLKRAGHPAPVDEIVADITDREALGRALEGVDVVFHTASVVDWGVLPDAVVESVNVEGTACVLDAARSAGVRAVVHTSSVDAVYSGRPIVEGDESMPTPSHFPNTYCRTKAQAEQRVLAVHHPEATPRVVVLRLVGLYGERDPYHLGQVLKMARRAPLVRIGDGTAKADHMYVGNAAHALLVAAADLLGEAKGAGSIYFVTDHAPTNFFDFVEPIVTGVGLRVLPWSLALPQRLMWVLGALLEAVAWCLGPLISWRPGLSRFAVDFVCQEITCSSQRFRKELGYTPKYSHREALDRTIAWFVRHPVA